MGRPKHSIKQITTSFRITQDMDRYIGEAADQIGASKGELYRLGAYETAKKILSDDKFAEELKIRFTI